MFGAFICEQAVTLVWEVILTMWGQKTDLREVLKVTDLLYQSGRRYYRINQFNHLCIYSDNSTENNHNVRACSVVVDLKVTCKRIYLNLYKKKRNVSTKRNHKQWDSIQTDKQIQNVGNSTADSTATLPVLGQGYSVHGIEPVWAYCALQHSCNRWRIPSGLNILLRSSWDFLVMDNLWILGQSTGQAHYEREGPSFNCVPSSCTPESYLTKRSSLTC